MLYLVIFFLFLMRPPPPRSTQTDSLFPYTSLFGSQGHERAVLQDLIALRIGEGERRIQAGRRSPLEPRFGAFDAGTVEIHELIDGGIGGREAAAHPFLADEILVARGKGGDVEADMIAGKADAALHAFAAFGAAVGVRRRGVAEGEIFAELVQDRQ